MLKPPAKLEREGFDLCIFQWINLLREFLRFVCLKVVLITTFYVEVAFRKENLIKNDNFVS